MAKPESWRLDVASYPIMVTANTRFQDMDVNGHLNNVAFAALFENARIQFSRSIGIGGEHLENERLLVAVVTINYLREGSYPDDVTIATGVGHIGNSSWVLMQAMFQHSNCIAICDTVVACKTDGQSKPLRANLADRLRANLAKPA